MPTLEQGVSRRQVLKVAGALGCAAKMSHSVLGVPGDTAPKQLLQLGIFSEIFAGRPLEARLDAAKAAGLDCMQLGMDAVGLAPMPDEIPQDILTRISRAAADSKIEVASLRGTFNMCHPDPEYRKGGVRRIGVLAQAAAKLGVPRIHLCTGTRDRINMWKYNPKNSSPEAWQDTVACVRDAVSVAKSTGVMLAFEPEVNNVVDSGKKARQLLDEVGSPLLKVTMDGSNLYHKGELARQEEVMDEAFALVGKDIVMAHAKDVSHDGDAGHEPAGHGKLNYEHYITLLHRCGMKGPLILHSLSEAQVPECVAFLREKMARVAEKIAKEGK